MLCQANYSTQCTQLASRLSNITTVTTGQKTMGSENAVWPPDDGRKDARNMLRNYWLRIKSLIVASSWSHLYLLIKDARSFEYKVILKVSSHGLKALTYPSLCCSVCVQLLFQVYLGTVHDIKSTLNIIMVAWLLVAHSKQYWYSCCNSTTDCHTN